MRWVYLILGVILLVGTSTYAQTPIPTIHAQMGRGEVGDIRLNPTGDILAVATNIGVWLYDFPSLTDNDFFPSDAEVYDVAWMPNGVHLLTYIDDHIVIWDIHKRTIITTISINLNADIDADKIGIYRFLYPIIREWDWVNWQSPNRQYTLKMEDSDMLLYDTHANQPITTLYEDFAAEWGYIRSLVWASDNQHFFIITDRSQLLVTNIATGQIQRFGIDSFWAERARWSPDSRYVLGGWGNRLNVWDVTTGEQIYLLTEGHAGPILWSEWSQNGQYLITAGLDSLVVVWDMHTGEVINQLIQHATGAEDMVWSPDGTKIATSNGGWQAMIWDVAGEQVLHHLIGHGFFTYGVTWSPDSRCVASIGDGSSRGQDVIIWDSTTGSIMHNLETSFFYQLGWTSEYGCLSYGSRGELLVAHPHIQDMLTDYPFYPFSDTENLLSPDNRWLVHTTYERVTHLPPLDTMHHDRFDSVTYKVVTIWDTQTGIMAYRLPYTNYDENHDYVAWSYDSTQLAIVGLIPHIVLIVDMTTRTTSGLLYDESLSNKVWWSPNGEYIAFINYAEASVDIWSTHTHTRTYRINHTTDNIAWSPNSTQLATEYNGIITIWTIPPTQGDIP